MLLGRILFDARAAFLAGAMAALYPGAIGMSVFVLSEAPFCPFLVAQLLCWTIASRSALMSHSFAWALGGGVAAGCATLVRPSWLPFTPLAVILSLVVCRFRRRHVCVGLAMCAALVLTMAPWWYRNYRVTGRFVPTTLQVGASLYDGLNPRATGASNMRFMADFREKQRIADAARSEPLSDTYEYRLDRRLRDAAIAWSRQHPGRVLQLAGAKLMRMWSPWPNAQEMQSWPVRLATFFGYTPLLLLSVWGAVKFGRRGWPYVLCWLPAAYFTLLHGVFVSSIRYRQPAMLVFLLLAAGAVSQWNQREEGGAS